MHFRIIAPKTESGHSTNRHIHHLTPSNSTQNIFIKETREEGGKKKREKEAFVTATTGTETRRKK